MKFYVHKIYIVVKKNPNNVAVVIDNKTESLFSRQMTLKVKKTFT